MTIGDFRRGHRNGMWKALRIHRDVALDPRYLLARVIAFWPAVSLFFTLCASTIKNVLQALRPCFAGRANLIFKRPLQQAYSFIVHFAHLAK